MIIDSHVHIAKEPDEDFGDVAFTAEELIRHMDGAWENDDALVRVDMAVVQPHVCATMREDSWAIAHDYIAEVTRKYPSRLIGCVTVNPFHDLDSVLPKVRAWIKEKRFRAVKLHATVHGYHPVRARKRLLPIFEETEGLGVPIIIHTGDPPNSIPVLWVGYAKDFPKLNIVLSHLGTQKVSYADEARYVAENYPNIYLETGWGQLPRLKETVRAIGTKRLVFGSDAPIQEIGSQLRTVQVLAWRKPIGIELPRKELDGILGGNFAELIGL